jgi:alkyldihydroxyacetonephosphate synthase
MRREQVFWGWGEPGAGPSLPERAIPFLRDELGVDGRVVDRPVPLADVRLRPSELDPAVRRRLEDVVGAEHVRDDREMRVLRCRGKSYLDLLAQRAGDCEAAPDAVAAPADAAEVHAVLELCSDAGVAVIPFGGGTSVVGGLEPERGGRNAAISLDLARMDRVIAVDERSQTAVLGPGLRLPEANRALGARGHRLAHLPQSYEWATVGGCVATRSAGQSSTGHGRIDEQVVALRCATPRGELATLAVPASAAGPSLRELVVGSEGALGVITEITVRVRPAPGVRRHEAFFFRTFADGCAALRRLEQAGLAPDIARLSDEAETRVTLGLAGGGSALARAVLRARGYAEGCLLIAGWEGSGDAVGRRRGLAARELREAGAMAAGRRPGEAWAAARFAGPHLRDDLLDRGVMVETLESATTWSNLERVRDAVQAALAGAVCGCHVSHLYPTGASLYFTVFARRDSNDPAGQWRALKAAATDAIVESGGTITHHHAVGRDHAPWLAAELGTLGVDLLRAVKERCDPAGIMNPGVLLRS